MFYGPIKEPLKAKKGPKKPYFGLVKHMLFSRSKSYLEALGGTDEALRGPDLERKVLKKALKSTRIFSISRFSFVKDSVSVSII